MTLSLFSGCKKEIVSLLSEHWPLFVKEIFAAVSRNGFSGSYQAVFKSLKELQEDGIVVCRNKKYLLSDEWIDELNSFAGNLKYNYANNKKLPVDSYSKQLVFETIYEAETFLLKFVMENLDFSKGKPVMCLQWSHFWVPLFLDRQTYAIFKEKVPLIDGYSVTCGNTAIDRWCHEFWKKHFVNTRYGVNSSNSSEITAFDDFVIQFFYPKKLKQQIDKAFIKAKRVEDLDLKNLFETVFEQKTKIPALITRNKELAEQLKKETMEYFK